MGKSGPEQVGAESCAVRRTAGSQTSLMCEFGHGTGYPGSHKAARQGLGG